MKTPRKYSSDSARIKVERTGDGRIHLRVEPEVADGSHFLFTMQPGEALVLAGLLTDKATGRK